MIEIYFPAVAGIGIYFPAVGGIGIYFPAVGGIGIYFPAVTGIGVGFVHAYSKSHYKSVKFSFWVSVEYIFMRMLN